MSALIVVCFAAGTIIKGAVIENQLTHSNQPESYIQQWCVEKRFSPFSKRSII